MSSVWSRIISKPHYPSLIEHGYKIVKVIGHGSSCKVYEVERLNDGKKYAAKTVGDDVAMVEDDMPLEASILLHLTDVPNVPRLHDVFTTRFGTHVMIMDKPQEPFETLADMVAHSTIRKYPKIDTRCIMSNLVRILKDIDEFNISHMDIHSHNILISNSSDVTLVDFGNARYKNPLMADKTKDADADNLTVRSVCAVARSIDPSVEEPDQCTTLQELFAHPYFASPMDVDPIRF